MKVELGAKNCLYPLPTTLVGALVDGKPNYVAVAHLGINDFETISIGLHKNHYTNIGIRANKTFSINIPSVNLIKETDYCGIVSGRNHDKAILFKTFYGKLKTAPLIEQCPINMECQLTQTIDLPTHDLFMGKIVNTHADPAILTNGIVDFEKIQPILFVLNDQTYYGLGKKLAKAWNIGNELSNKTTKEIY
jgi:flavin reductase (DIM6/NTAB) family NADH-FMN oxidoreductase RutF